MDMKNQELLRQAAKMLIDPNSTLAEKDMARRMIAEYIRELVPKAANADYRVMQYNILRDGDGWGWAYLTEPGVECSRRIEPLCAIVEGYRPDVIGFAERYDCWEDEASLTARMNAYGYAIVENELPEEMRKTWHYGYPDSDFNRNPILYNTAVLELVKSNVTDIMAFPSINYRGLTCAIFKDKRTQQELAVFATHWESGGIQKEGVEPKTPSECRMINAEKTCAKLAELLENGKKRPVIVMGDFNTFPSDAAYQFLLKNGGLTDSAKDSNRIDHILIQDCKVLVEGMDTAPYTGYTSDHKPLYCDIKV